MSAVFRKSVKKVKGTPFSDFIRHASSAEKKRVYTLVLKRASDRQEAVVLNARKSKGAADEEACAPA